MSTSFIKILTKNMANLKLDSIQKNKFIDNLLLFLAPVAVIYIVPVTGIIQINNGAVKLSDFIPSQFTYGAITLYILNILLDYFRKLASPPPPPPFQPQPQQYPQGMV